MHRALYIQEILFNIFGHCCPIESYWMPGRRSFTTDLAVLARTCHTFKDPALDVLWSELVDLSPLVRCLPDVCQSIGTCYSFKRHLNEREWEKLRSYTRRIWHISGYSNIQGWLDNDNFMAVCNPPIGADPLFPNLRSFYWQGMALIPVAHAAVPSLTTLDLHFTHKHVPVLKDFLDVIGALCPNISRLRMHGFHCQLPPEVVSSYISRWANLCALDFHGVVMNANMISRLSEISGLAHLSFTLIPGAADRTPPSGSVSVFSRLVYLETTSESLEPVTALFSCTQLPVLQSLTVVCLQRPSKEAFRSYMTTVRNVCSPDSLVTFMFFNIKSMRFPLYGIPDGETDDRLTVDDLWPCMDFVNLRQIRIDIKWSVALTDADLLALVSAWPRIQVLHVNGKWGWRTTGGITLRGVLELLEKRRSLSLLCIAIHTQSFTALLHERRLDKVHWQGLVPPPPPSPSPSPNPSPPLILLSDSVIRAADVRPLVNVFVRLRPYFHFVALDPGLCVGNQEGAEDRGRRWRRVSDGVSERLSTGVCQGGDGESSD